VDLWLQGANEEGRTCHLETGGRLDKGRNDGRQEGNLQKTTRALLIGIKGGYIPRLGGSVRGGPDGSRLDKLYSFVRGVVRKQLQAKMGEASGTQEDCGDTYKGANRKGKRGSLAEKKTRIKVH